jgi:hypothetical protein
VTDTAPLWATTPSWNWRSLMPNTLEKKRHGDTTL